METRHPNSYSIAPAFWIAQSDLFGPVQTNVPGREQNTRANPSLSAKYWVMVLAQGLSRMSCEVGTPARLLIDQDSAFMKVLKDAEVTNVDLETHMRVRATMDFQLCPVPRPGRGQHQYHTGGSRQSWLLQESDINSTPLEVTMARTASNTPLLKLITPDHLRLGRISNRIPSAPFQLPDSPKDMIPKAEVA